ncbi:MAG: GNAT family N-acetyltransferase [Pyrinomonadaceae bacterium]
MNLSLRPATKHDLALLDTWGRQPHVVAAGVDIDHWELESELGRTVAWREYLIAEVNGRPLGFLQIIDPKLDEWHYWGDCLPNLRAIDIWIGNAEDLGKGYGTEMMKQAIDRCFAAPDVNAIIIDPIESNTRAHKFYERLDFDFVERRKFADDYCLVFRLDRSHCPPQ